MMHPVALNTNMTNVLSRGSKF